MFKYLCTAVSSEAWAKLRDWASVAGRGRLLLSGSVAQASLKTAVQMIILSTLLTQRGNCRENGERGRVVDVSDQEVSPTLPEDGLIANPVDFFDALVDRRDLARTALLSLSVVPEKSEKDANNVAQ